MTSTTLQQCQDCGAQPHAAQPGGALKFLVHRDGCLTTARFERSARLHAALEREDAETEEGDRQ